MSQAARRYLYLLLLEGLSTERLIFFYASDSLEAESRASDYELDHNARRSDLRQLKNFRSIEIELPGQIEEPEQTA
jgi:hypothetical protein